MTSPADLERLKYLNSKRVAVQVTGLPLIALSVQALGITFSDIGTSPLYVLQGIWPPTRPVPPKEDVIGGISAIIWALTLLPLLKYMYIALYFGTDEGEGGSFALFQALYRPKDQNLDEDRTLTGESHFGKERPVARTFKQKARWPLLLWCLFGTALTMADGVFTPAVSVTTAVTGIGVANRSIEKDTMPISIVFLLALFFIQPFGTARLAVAYAPISLIWFLLLFATGIYNITFFPGIFRAFDPSQAILLFVRTKNYGLLSGILLAVTGCEAMFANLGQFNALSIRLAFCLFVYPALIFAYLGQGARMIDNGQDVIINPFYKTIPGPVNGPFYWIVFIVGVLAALIASQALITATFSLVQQLIHSKAFPPIRMVHTSEKIQGQIYIPAFNWALMVATIVIVAVLPDLTNAYGFAVATVMFSTSVLIAIHIPAVKHLPVVLGIAYFLSFGFFDALFWGAAFSKVRHGAWVPLLMGVVLVLIMLLWVWAKRLEDDFDGQNRMNLREFIRQSQERAHSGGGDQTSSEGGDPSSHYYVHNPMGDPSEKGTDEEQWREIQRISTFAVFHKTAAGKGVPHTFVGFIRQWPALPRVAVFLSVCVVPLPRVPVDERYIVTKVRSVEGFYGVTYYIGFRDKFDLKSEDLIERICALEGQFNRGHEVPATRLEEIRAAGKITTHIAPRYHVVSKKVDVGYISPAVNYIRAFLIESLYRRLTTIFPETGNWLTPADEIIHVGGVEDHQEKASIWLRLASVTI